jgi:hypothetical protein
MMTSGSQIEGALQSGKQVLAGFGRHCWVSADDLKKWFDADTLYPDVTLNDVLENPWLVIHEIVEIDAVKRAGLQLSKDVIIANSDVVERAHYEAAKIELEIAIENRAAVHIRDRIPDIRNWSKDEHVLPKMRMRYERLCSATEQALRTIEDGE